MTGATPGPKVLFLSHDGVLGGPGRSQVIPYLRGYREAGWQVDLLSFEKPDLLRGSGLREEVEEELVGAGIPWTRLPYRRRPLADLLAGRRALRKLVRERNPDLLHARSYVPALLAESAGRGHGARVLFDMRGFWVDEKVDGGLWPAGGLRFRIGKRLERFLLRRADGVVVLAQAGADVLRGEGLLPEATPLVVIPCGADLERFRPVPESGVPDRLAPFEGKRIYTFLGATGTWYLKEEMLDFAADTVRADADARVLFLTEGPAGAIAMGLENRRVPRDRFLVDRAPHGDVPAWISSSHAGVFFIRPCRSKKASCPTKLAEFLACGIPVVVNAGIGDMDSMVGGRGLGAVLSRLDPGAFADARERIGALHAGGGIREKCRREAECRFDARKGSRDFVSLAERLVRR